ncbi:MAG: NHLP bacteriocin export ABC transporter permease/ATPase subunit [Oscillospiraceae bacterium]|nr:NHLP bacteriocin export ABC transporter permease/ATPase subunit [Oscillospiraceae bacterium]
MTTEKDTIELTSADVFYPGSPQDAYRVESGEVLVYIVPWESGKPGRRLLLCEVPEKRVIPALVFRDADYAQWRFALAPRDAAVIRLMKDSVTSILHQNFLKRAGITTYEQEGFERSLAEHYKRESLKDDVFISRGQSAEPEARVAAFAAVANAFENQQTPCENGDISYRAMGFVGKYLGVPIIAEEELVIRCGKNPTLPAIAKISNVICRKIVLEANWHKSDCGAFVSTVEGKTVACVPGRTGKYKIFYAEEGRVEPMTDEIARTVDPRAYSLSRALPRKKMTVRDIVRFCAKSITLREILLVAALTLVCALIGILMPTLNQMIYDDYIPLGDFGSLVQMSIVMVTFMAGNLMFSIVKNLASFCLTSRMGNELQNAAYHRLFFLPQSFFRNYDSADLGRRVMSIGSTANHFAATFIITGFSALFSLVYLIRMCSYSGKLTWVGVGMYLVYALVVTAISASAKKKEAEIAEADAQASSKLYQYINGIDKIRMAGVEERALLSYMQPYSRQQTIEIRNNRLVSVAEVLTGISSTVFSMVLYLLIVKNKMGLSVGSFIAFNTAFGSFTGSLQALLDQCLEIYQTKDVAKRFMPIFETKPEDDDSKETPGALTGAIELDRVSFTYVPGSRNVLNELSLRINPGEYIGIVGSSGCGKSTLLKLLLGFETPNSGMVLLDGKDLRSLDKGAYRKQLGVVLQNGRLIAGSIYDNITITHPGATMAEVNAVIDAVGLREDLNNMPMGIHTMLSENCNTISGGQQQRILIARAIIGKPAILIFDEATSALDNLTQAAVSSNLDKMKLTRIVVAHRLSTIKNCDRIIVLQDGAIAEEGNYDSLMARKGLFFALASRQIAQ